MSNIDNDKDPKAFHDDIESHEYDGIKEQNNPTPFWITLIFLLTFGFALFYAVYYFGYPGNEKDQTSEYNRSVTEHKEKQDALKAVANEGKPKLAMEEMVSKGEQLYSKNGCMACHGASGEGNAIGPNLTDKFWINGCSEQDIIKIIKNGKPTKGMTPYGSMMTDDEMLYVTQYILNKLVGSNPASPKDPQGEECN